MLANELTKSPVYVAAHNIYSPLGHTTQANFNALKAGETGVKEHLNEQISAVPIHASLFPQSHDLNAAHHQYTRFERMVIASVQDAVSLSGVDLAGSDTIFILSSTKGNISLLETEEHTPELQARISLAASAKIIANHFKFKNTPVVISNACISGVLAITTAMRLLRSGQYQNAVVAGADEVSRFVASGFQSFKALADGVCQPFDRDRTGLNLGEGAGTLVLSTNARYAGNIRVLGGSVSNDANHISGPSRTGQELSQAIDRALDDAGITPAQVDFISAHGTATVYNDEMEASAIGLSGVQNAPVNSLKANYGHTLGAAGLIESIISIQSVHNGLVLPTLGFKHLGVTQPIIVNTAPLNSNVKTFLKTASGFGGCNAAVIFGV